MKYRHDMHVYIDNPEVRTGTLPDILNYITEYRFQGGPEQPIRYLEMKVNKNDIDLAFPNLIDSIVEGKTRMIIDAVGGGTFVITKIWLNDNTYELVATGIEITLNTASLDSTDVANINATNLDPPAVVNAIFQRWKDTLNLTTQAEGFDDDYEIYFSSSLSPTRNPSVSDPNYDPTAINQITFKENMPTLVAINMCALMDNAFIFFANRNGVNTMYYVSYEDINPLAYNPADSSKNGVVNLYPRMDSQYINYTKFDLMMFKRLMGMSSKRSEGSETIVNTQFVSTDGSQGEWTDNDSYDMYGDYTGVQVISDMIVTSYAQLIAKNIVRRYKDPTRSITITLSEVGSDSGGTGWDEAIPIFSYAKKIVDNVNNITLENVHLSDGSSDNFMLRLSTFIRYYPEMITEYTFGVMKETTLSQELANKLTGMSGTITDIRVNGTSIANNGVVTVDTTPSSDQSQNPAHLVTSNGVYNAIQSAISGVAPSGTIGDDIHPLKLVNGTLTPVTGVIADVKYNNQTVASSGVVTVDLTPTDNSHNPVSSDGVYDAIDDLKTLILGAIYPVGSIYMNMNNTMPTVISNLGTWERIGEGTALISAGTNYTAGSSYGANTKTITADNLPEHTHSLSNHSHTISDAGWGTTSFGPMVLEGYDTGCSGAIYTNQGTLTSTLDDRRDSWLGGNRADDTVASSGSSNRSKYATITVSNHNHGGSTGDAGGGNTGNNTTNKDDLNVMQLSVAVCMWKRTA